MLRLQKKRLLGWAGLIVLLAACAAAWFLWKACTTPTYLKLPDGTEAFFHWDSKITPASQYPQPREIAVDGDIFFRVPAAAQPLTLRSRLLVLTVTGKTAFRMTAYAKEAGEQVEVLYGNITAHKNYKSPYQEPDVLTGGQMTMINRSIDLMEKETTDLPALRAWSDKMVDSASGKP
jgi:ferric-dicitrate binding protein FerR (iron transport regulator)